MTIAVDWDVKHQPKRTNKFIVDAPPETEIFERKIVNIFSYPSVLVFVLGAHGDSSFEYPQHIMFWLRKKKSIFNPRKKCI